MGKAEATRAPHGQTTAWYHKDKCRCEPCVTYKNKLTKAARLRSQLNPRVAFGSDGTDSGLVIDILETHQGTWWTAEQLDHEVARIRGEAPGTQRVSAICQYLIRRQRVKSRMVLVGKTVPPPKNALYSLEDHTYAYERLQVMCPRREYLFTDDDLVSEERV